MPQVTPPTQTWFAKNTGPIIREGYFFVSFTLALAMILVLKLHQTREWSFLPSDNPLLSLQQGTIYTFKNGLYLPDNHFSSPDLLLRDPHHTLEDCGYILCRPLLLLPSIIPSIRVFSNELILHIRWPKYWSFRFSISPSNEYSVLISFRIDWFDLAAGATLKSLLQHHSAKASIALTFRLLYDPMSGNV